MIIVFCSNPLELGKPDPAYEAEVSAVKSLGLEYVLVNYEALTNENDLPRAVRRVAESSSSELGLYRGWMLRPEKYRQLFNALADKGIRLINDPAAYVHCHYLPESYSVIKHYTPLSVWLRSYVDASINHIMHILRAFGSRPVVVKDFVKSRKYEWEEACYIPSASDQRLVEPVVRRFIELQGEELNEGLVFREFVEFEPLTQHSKSKMPLTKEFRIFFLDSKPIYSIEYWEEGDYRGTTPSIEQFRDVAKAVQSRFFTMDIAKRLDGEWMIVELGDGQVAGLPGKADVLGFYKALVDHWPGQE